LPALGKRAKKNSSRRPKAKSKTNAVVKLVTGKRKQENFKAAAKVTWKGKNANKSAAGMKSRKVQD